MPLPDLEEEEQKEPEKPQKKQAIRPDLMRWLSLATSIAGLTAIAILTFEMILGTIRFGTLLAYGIGTAMMVGLLISARAGACWAAVVILHVAARYSFDRLGWRCEQHLSATSSRFFEATGLLGLLLCVLSLTVLYESFKTSTLALIETRNKELEEAIEHVQQLQRILPICMYCRKIRDEGNVWQALEHYMESHSGVVFSHGLCEDCMEQHYPEPQQLSPSS